MSVTLRVWVALIRQALMRDLQFRSQAWIHLAASVGELIAGIVPVLVVTSYAEHDPAIPPASLLAVGVFAVTTGLMDCFVSPGLRRFDLAIRQGELDLAIIRPVPTFFYAVMRWIQPTELGRCLTGMAIVLVATETFDLGPSAYAVASMLVWAFVGTVAYCAFWANLTFLAFWVRSIEPVNDLAAAWRGSGQYPRRFFPRTFQIVLVSFAPAALGGSYPAEQLLEPTPTLLLAPIVLIASCSLTALVWRRGLARYDSASS
ncbi:ABC transporter permease [Allostreptomyces psammosilenae]|uniref:ABC-2 type transport system permease protein n=1 Tax=Allostreptomyces psammosilenae TaxID=1892865 RepID=A0A852ZPK1_9ACTN|nr:ABC-2 family transporter protein [Allostreptomyces psammosilenae]NYI04376.1 ABC-2 type transport system permease protein [Allostreptomyces psammosilenae]